MKITSNTSDAKKKGTQDKLKKPPAFVVIVPIVLRTENDQRIYDRKIAEKAVQEWANGLDVPAATKPLTFGELHEKFLTTKAGREFLGRLGQGSFDLTHDANRVGMDVEPKFDYAGFLRLNIYSSDSCTCSGLKTVGMLSMRVTYPALSRASSLRQWMMVRAYGAIIPRRSTGNAMTS